MATGKEGVRAEIARAERRARRPKFDDPPVGEARLVNGAQIKPGEWKPGADGLPPDCPVKVLGREGSLLHVADAKGQLISIKPTEFGQNVVQSLFQHRHNYLLWAWPRWTKDRAIDTFRTEQVREALYHAAGLVPLFSPASHTRGRGAWLDRSDELVYHSGDALWSRDGSRAGLREEEVGLRRGHFYPLLAPLEAPWPARIETRDNPARDLYKALLSWHWERPLVDPVLLLGWIGCGLVSGALQWRPNIYVTGDRATGKSSLLELVKLAMGDALVKAGDASAAGVTQTLRSDALAVALDENEAEDEQNQRQAQNLMKLAKIASSGDTKLRGGSDHNASSFAIRSCFLFASINTPPLRPEDISRMAVLRMRPLAELPSRLKSAPAVDAERTASMLLRRLFDEWHRLPQTLDAYFEVLRQAGHPDRGQKTFGTMLAMADLLLGPEIAEELGLPMVEGLSPWAERLNVARLSEYDDMNENWRNCLNTLLAAPVEAWRNGTRSTIGGLIDEFYQGLKDGDGKTRDEVNALLDQAGVQLLWHREVDPDPEGFLLAIPNENPRVRALFKGSRFVGQPGASVWPNALRQAPAALLCTDKRFNRVRIGGAQTRATLVRLRALREEEKRE